MINMNEVKNFSRMCKRQKCYQYQATVPPLSPILLSTE